MSGRTRETVAALCIGQTFVASLVAIWLMPSWLAVKISATSCVILLVGVGLKRDGSPS